MMIGCKKCITVKAEGARQRGKTWQEVVNKDVNDVHLKPSDAMGCSKRRLTIRGNCSDSNSESRAES